MDISYFIDNMCDELEDSKRYLQDAIEVKAMNAEWSKKMFTMSEQEMEHAKHWYTMLQEYFTAKSNRYAEMGREVPSSLQKVYKKAISKYLECSTKIMSMKTMY